MSKPRRGWILDDTETQVPNYDELKPEGTGEPIKNPSKPSSKTKQIMTLPDDPSLWEKMRVEIRGAIQPHVRDIAMAAAQYKMDLGISVDMNKVNLDILKFTREYTNDWWAKLEATRREGLREALMTWQESGLGKRGLPDLLDAMETVFFDKTSADMIAVTEVTRIFDEGNRIIEREAGIKTQEWQTAEDETVCEICVPLNLKHFPIDQGPYPVTDTHPNCRCARLGVGSNDEVIGE
jgi:SPP1 gp7 family putative phage head morphogenesis protein